MHSQMPHHVATCILYEIPPKITLRTLESERCTQDFPQNKSCQAASPSKPLETAAGDTPVANTDKVVPDLPREVTMPRPDMSSKTCAAGLVGNDFGPLPLHPFPSSRFVTKTRLQGKRVKSTCQSHTATFHTSKSKNHQNPPCKCQSQWPRNTKC